MNLFFKITVCFIFFIIISIGSLSAENNNPSSGHYFTEVYADFAQTNLLGSSSFSRVRFGWEKDNIDYYGLINYQWANTNGSQLPYQYLFQGTSVGVGVRYWFPKKYMTAIIEYSRGVTGDVENENTLEAGFVGYRSFEKEKEFSDIYGQFLWVSNYSDVFLNVRYRPGITLMHNSTSRLWAYIVGEIWASGQEENGTDNRIEVGPGIGYLFLNGHMSANFDLRFGHSFRGAITKENYFNPTFVLSFYQFY